MKSTLLLRVSSPPPRFSTYFVAQRKIVVHSSRGKLSSSIELLQVRIRAGNRPVTESAERPSGSPSATRLPRSSAAADNLSRKNNLQCKTNVERRRRRRAPAARLPPPPPFRSAFPFCVVVRTPRHDCTHRQNYIMRHP
jgi:hypothetical protein